MEQNRTVDQILNDPDTARAQEFVHHVETAAGATASEGVSQGGTEGVVTGVDHSGVSTAGIDGSGVDHSGVVGQSATQGIGGSAQTPQTGAPANATAAQTGTGPTTGTEGTNAGPESAVGGTNGGQAAAGTPGADSAVTQGAGVGSGAGMTDGGVPAVSRVRTIAVTFDDGRTEVYQIGPQA